MEFSMELSPSMSEYQSQQYNLSYSQYDRDEANTNASQDSELGETKTKKAPIRKERATAHYSHRLTQGKKAQVPPAGGSPIGTSSKKSQVRLSKAPDSSASRGKSPSKRKQLGVDLRSSEHWGLLQAVLSYTKSKRAFKHEATLAENIIFGLAEADVQGSSEKVAKVVSNLIFPSSAAYSVSQFCLGYCYLHGLGMTIDPCQAASCFASAADKEYAPAQWGFAFCLEFGVGVPRIDFSSAVILLTGAVNQGFQPAAHPLSHLLAVMPLGALLS